MDWNTHEEDVWFDFRGSRPEQLVPSRFYRGSVDGFADFGVFVDLCPQVTGLLHRSELDRRLESLDWDPGDTVFVQVKNVRDNGNVDLAWSIRQSEREFRGAKIHDPEGEHDGEDIETSDDGDDGPVRHTPQQGNAKAGNAQAATGGASEPTPDETESETTDVGVEDAAAVEDVESDMDSDAVGAGVEDTATGEESDATEAPVDTDDVAERAEVASLADRVDERVRVEAEVTRIRQTSGPTVFGLEDETGTVDAAAFVEAGVRAYPDV